ncbi:MAG: hypothetical protein AAFN27_23575 [Pseudomonadota bacterium]
MTDYTSKLRDPEDTLQMFKRYSLACADGNREGVDYENLAGSYDNIRHGTVTYRKLLPPTGFFKKFKKKKPDDEARKVSRPVMVRKIFPDGGGAVNLVKRWRTLRY